MLRSDFGQGFVDGAEQLLDRFAVLFRRSSEFGLAG